MTKVAHAIALVLAGAVVMATPLASQLNASRSDRPRLVARTVEVPSPFDDGSSQAFGINERGEIVGWVDVFGDRQAFRWSPHAGVITLGPGAALDLNRAGVVVGHGPDSGTVTSGIVWIDDVAQTIVAGEATDVNEAGVVVGWHYWPSTVYSAIRWMAPSGPLEDLGTLLGYGYFAGFSQALGVNEAGVVVGWSTSAATGMPHAMRWTPQGGMVDLGAPADMSSATDVNRHNVTVGWAGASRDAPRAAMWSKQGAFTWLATLGGDAGQALAVNDFGQIAGWTETATGERHAVVWLAGGRVIDLGPGEAHDINNAGQAAGWRPRTDGVVAAIWQLTPAARGHR